MVSALDPNSSIQSMYEWLADFLLQRLDLHNVRMVLEAGCGKGQLTIPLANKIGNVVGSFRMIAVDVSSGPYRGSLDVLRRRVREMRLEERVAVVEADCRSMKGVEDESVDLIVSNELFCDLDREGLEKALKEFYRVLKPGGQMAHGNLSPIPENVAQELLVKADAHSTERLAPKYEWFSPHADEVAAKMHRLGFRSIRVEYFETNLHLSFKDAVKQLKEWAVDPVFIKEHSEELKKHGIEFPIEHVIFCRK